MTTGEIIALLGAVAMVGFAAILAVAETAITRISTARAEALAEEGRRGAGVLRTLIDDRERVLNPVLLVVLACQLGAATVVAVLVDRHWGLGALFGVFAIELILVYVFAEALPKTWSLARPDRSATTVAPLARALSAIAPLRWLANGLVSRFSFQPEEDDPHGDVAEEELLALAEEAAASDAIDEQERHIIEQIIEFGDTVANEVMVPRTDMVAVAADTTVDEASALVIAQGFSRMPVHADGVDDIVGVVHAKDLMRAAHVQRGADAVTSIMRDVRFVPESKHIAQLMQEMQAEKFHIAIVVDEYGGTAGLVTLEDLIEEVLGEIVDEFDIEQPMIEQLDAGLRVNGRVALADLVDVLSISLPEGDWSTVGGLIFSTLGHVPAVGESIEVDSYRFLVERVQGRRIARVLVTETVPSAASVGSESL